MFLDQLFVPERSWISRNPAIVAASITAAGPHLAPTIENLTFVDQGGWKLSHDSAMTLIQSVQSAGG